MYIGHFKPSVPDFGIIEPLQAPNFKFFMSNASNQDGYDPYRIDAIAEIDQILLDIIKQGALVRMHAGDSNHAVITTLVSIDFDKEQLIIDSAAQELINRQLIAAGTAHLSTQINQVSIEFQVGPISAGSYEGRPALITPIPDYLRRIQRRDSFRVQPVSSNAATLTVTLNEESITLKVFDISAGGLSLLDEQSLLAPYDVQKGTILKDCLLTLPGVGDLTIDLRIVRLHNQTMASGKQLTRYGGAFFQLEARDEIKVQNFINQEERLRIARERGLA